MTKEMRQWQAATNGLLAALEKINQKFPNARFLVLAINPELDDMAMVGTGCPHDNDQMLNLAMDRNDEALMVHAATGEHGRN